jgi:ABC-2 type transport system permease protein
MELLLSTPVKPIEIIIGKVLPYLGFGFIAVSFVYLTARIGFGVPFRGSHIIFLIGTFLFLTTCFCQGILISVATRIQQVAMQAALTSGLMPSLLLSGFLFPLSNMPLFFQIATSALGVRWFMEISRVSFLRESSLSGIQTAFLALTLISIGMVALALKRFKTDVEP